MKKIIPAAIALIAIAGIGAVYAAGNTKFAQADSNHDGKLTWEEAQADFPNLSRVLFDAADENKDGTLSETEYTGLYTLCPE